MSTVRAFIRRHGVFRPGPIVLAVSGGTDSVALALILAQLRDEFGLVLHVAHFDHRTRPRTAPKDAAFVADLADRIGAPIRIGRAPKSPASEEDARTERYAFLRRAASEIGASAIVTGHTQDDQAETVLLHLTRGAGIAGAAAMRPLREGIARPLLAIGRADTDAICRAAKIRPREDPSNRSLRFARNRVRRNVLPELAKINPQVRAALARFAEAAAQIDASHADAETAPETIDISDLPSDPARRDRVLADAWRVWTGRTLTARQREALLALAATTDGTRRIDLPGGTAVREYAALRRATVRTRTQTAETPLVRGTFVQWHGWRIALGMDSDGLAFSGTVDDDTASRLVVRARRPGDRLARGGKLQDLFVDAKVPAGLRDEWPVLALDQTIVWVPGLSQAPRAGRVSVAAGPADGIPMAGEAVLIGSSHNRRVASSPRTGRKGSKGDRH